MADFSDRQKEIIDASINIIAEHGIQELTIKHLSEAIGLSEPALYRHFENKFAILQAILTYFAERSSGIFSRILASGGSASDQLRDVFKTHFALFTERPAVSAVLYSEEIFHNDERLNRTVVSIMETARASLLRIISGGLERREFRSGIPAEHLTLIFMGTLRLFVTRWRLSGYSFDLEAEGRGLLSSLLAFTLSDRQQLP